MRQHTHKNSNIQANNGRNYFYPNFPANTQRKNYEKCFQFIRIWQTEHQIHRSEERKQKEQQPPPSLFLNLLFEFFAFPFAIRLPSSLHPIRVVRNALSFFNLSHIWLTRKAQVRARSVPTICNCIELSTSTYFTRL